MSFSFRDRYRLLWRALRVACNPKSSEALFLWREEGKSDVIPHAFYAENTKGTDLILDCFTQVVMRSDSLEEANKIATGFFLKVAAAYCDKNKLPRDHLVIYATPIIPKEDLDQVKQDSTITASYLPKQ